MTSLNEGASTCPCPPDIPSYIHNYLFTLQCETRRRRDRESPLGTEEANLVFLDHRPHHHRHRVRYRHPTSPQEQLGVLFERLCIPNWSPPPPLLHVEI